MRNNKIVLGAVMVAFIGSNLYLVMKNLELRAKMGRADRMVLQLRSASLTRKQPRLKPEQLRNAAFYYKPAEQLGMMYSYQEAAPKGWAKEVEGRKGDYRNAVPRLSLLDVRQRFFKKEETSRLTLFVFFSPMDCPPCLEEVSFWRKLHRESRPEDLAILAILAHPNIEEARAFAERGDIPFSYVIDENSLLKSLFGIDETPYKIVIDAAGEIRLIGPRAATLETQREFYESVKRLLED